MAKKVDKRPPVAVGHVSLHVKDVPKASAFMQVLGLRHVFENEKQTFAVLELRGGTHLILNKSRKKIRDGDVATLSKCPGIGKKTAERLVIELRSRIGSSLAPAADSTPTPGTGAGNTGGALSDAVAALSVLGYKTAEADKAVRQAMIALGGDASTEQLIKHALGR